MCGICGIYDKDHKVADHRELITRMNRVQKHRGPDDDGIITVEETASALSRYWDAVKFRLNPPADQPHEANLLRLDCSKARYRLQWHGVLSPEECFQMTAEWYRNFYDENRILTKEQIERYTQLAASRKLSWC